MRIVATWCRSVVVLGLATSGCAKRQGSDVKDVVTDLNAEKKVYHYQIERDSRNNKAIFQRAECVGGLTESFCNKNAEYRDYDAVKKRLADLIKLPPQAQVTQAIAEIETQIGGTENDISLARTQHQATKALLATREADLAKLGPIDLNAEKLRVQDLNDQVVKLTKRLKLDPNNADVKSLLDTVTAELAVAQDKVGRVEALQSEIATLTAQRTEQERSLASLAAKRMDLNDRLATLQAEKAEIAGFTQKKFENLVKLLEDDGVGYRILTATDLFLDQRADAAHLDTAFESEAPVAWVKADLTNLSLSQIWTAMFAFSDGTVVARSGNSDAQNRTVAWLRDGKEIARTEVLSFRTMTRLKTSDTLVITSLGGEVTWWDQNGQEIGHAKTKAGFSDLVLLPDDTVVLANGTQVTWLKDGQKTFEFELDRDAWGNLFALKDGSIVIEVAPNGLRWLKDGAQIGAMQTQFRSYRFLQDLNPSSVLVSSSEDSVRRFTAGKDVGSLGVKFKVENAAVLSDGTIVGVTRDTMSWVKPNKQVVDLAIGTSPFLRSLFALPDDVLLVGCAGQDGDGDLCWFKDGAVFARSPLNTVRVVLADGTAVVISGSDLCWIKDGVNLGCIGTDLSPMTLRYKGPDGVINIEGRWLKDGKVLAKSHLNEGLDSAIPFPAPKSVIGNTRDGEIYWIKL